MALTLFMARHDNALLPHDQLLILIGRERQGSGSREKMGGVGCRRDEGGTG